MLQTRTSGDTETGTEHDVVRILVTRAFLTFKQRPGRANQVVDKRYVGGNLILDTTTVRVAETPVKNHRPTIDVHDRVIVNVNVID